MKENTLHRAAGLLAAVLIAGPTCALGAQRAIKMPGLEHPVRVVRDVDGMPHILGTSELDVLRVQGWMHANDRLFQMDQTRRLASGTLSELLGPDQLGSDVELQTIGLRRAAERSFDAASPELRAAAEAYAGGVNTWIATHALPSEYAELELSAIAPWTALDSLVIGKAIAFNLSFDLDDIDRTTALSTYQEVGAGLGFDGTALFFEDLFRSQPFDPAATIPDASGRAAARTERPKSWKARALLSPSVRQMLRDYRARVARVPWLAAAATRSQHVSGSNEWAVAGRLTTSGQPLLANDPHLALDFPATFYQNHLWASADGVNVAGSSFPGAPFVILGQSPLIAWGATTNPLDVTDTYVDVIAPDPQAPAGFRIVHEPPNDALDRVDALPLTFRYNVIGDGQLDNLAIAPPSGDIPPLAFIVPRRNQGPIVSLNTFTGEAITIQFTGFSATREVETFRLWNRARNLEEFRAALDFFDFGSQNFSYADVAGNIAYFTSAELPLREDLQAGVVTGLPPFFIRDGKRGNEWLPVTTPQPGQAIAYEILPYAEMPQITNPPAGFFVNANNDPSGNTLDNDPLNELRPGGGIYYLNPGYDGFRGGRITHALRERLDAGPVTRADMQAIQADVVMIDAQALGPYLVGAFRRARAEGSAPVLARLAADERLEEAIGRIAAWSGGAPTGIAEGYDASDVDGTLSEPDRAEIDASIAATLYGVWRGQVIANTLDATLERVGALAGVEMPQPGSSESMTALRNLLDNFATQQGVGASGLDFFEIPGSSDPPDVRRDALLLESLADALDLLASDAFAAAFANSTDQEDYRWGKLHRIVLDHPLGEPYSVPPGGGLFPPPLAGLMGIPVDGGFGVPDASGHSARADSVDEFMYGSGPVRRYVGQPAGSATLVIRGETILPGGMSGVSGDPYSVNLLGRWLTNDTYPIRQQLGGIVQASAERLLFEP